MKKSFLMGNLLYLLILFLVLIVYVLKIFNPLAAETNELDNEHMINRMVISKLENQRANKAQMEKDLEDLRSQLQSVVDYENPEILSDRLAEGAAASGAVISALTVYQPKDTGMVGNVIPLAEISADITIKGDYQSFLSFISFLESRPKDAFYINSASMNSEENTGSVSITMYYQKTSRAEGR
ncbi:hypothetical protein SDC9_164590 [bioreactor metagenome]|uniref:Pilus assembly protein, PilO n=1 Tax=bioreactor metagenome TaxID=1076179 RepID=A0A645FUP4_9ZZZZ